MKIFACFLAFILLAGDRSYSQKYDSLNIEGISINQLSLGSNKKEIIKKFGTPAKIIVVPHVSESETAVEYHYKKSIIQFDNEKSFIGFNILDTSFVLSYHSVNIRIGDSISILRKHFPKTYKTYQKGGDKFFRLPFKGSDIQYLLITLRNNRIIRIETWEDHS